MHVTAREPPRQGATLPRAMIVVPEDGRLRVVTQSDHAHLAGEVVALWRADGLPANPRRPEIVRAVREHDNGWRETDSAPRVDRATGRPHDFRTLPAEVRREIWRRGAARLAATRPYAALLIVHHALVLHAGNRGNDAWDEDLLAPLDELYGELVETTGAPAFQVAADYRFLAVADALSLAACGALAGAIDPEGAAGHRVALCDGRVEIDPFPLAGATTFRVPDRSIPDRVYRGDADLGGELAAARWGAFAARIGPRSR